MKPFFNKEKVLAVLGADISAPPKA